ncbi:rhombosortase [Photobacterium sanctipauli]|uniref:Rhombosortase n=2 Tax=Photobacterium sanctipauli TaxID=1342794 RepID=A0A2T3NXM9_9GAMM|nr:rhombosortase [Photobacterium sanctipauli]
MAVFQLDGMQTLLAWDRSAISHGEAWRLLTGNFTHTNWPHMIMNSLALAIITFIFRRNLKLSQLTGFVVFSAAFIGSALWFSSTTWYAGLSGVLHGLFALGAIKDIQSKDKLGWALLVGVIVKVVWEQYSGGSASSARLIDARVAVEAHLLGVVSALLYTLANKVKASIAKRD